MEQIVYTFQKRIQIIKLIRNAIEVVAPEVLILTETNVPHKENISYFGKGDEAHAVYQFSLPPLLLHGLLNGTANHITEWASNLPPLSKGCHFLNFTASHDGIGVRPLEGILATKEIFEIGRTYKEKLEERFQCVKWKTVLNFHMN